MSILMRTAIIYYRRYNAKRDAVVDDVMQLRLNGKRVEIVDGIPFFRTIFRSIDPILAEAYVDRGAIVRANGTKEDVWYLNIRGSDGHTTGVRMRSKWDAKRMEKAILKMAGVK